MLQSSVAYGNILRYGTGCNWTIEFDDGTSRIMLIPNEYIGEKKCYFTAAKVEYDINDSIDVAVYALLDVLDFNDDNRSNINFLDNNIDLDSYLYTEVPSLWGPTIAEVHVWQ